MRRLALLMLAATLLVLLGPLVVGERVVYPHDNTLEVGLFGAGPLGPPSNRRLSDASHYYLPVLAQHLSGDSSGWLSLWDPHVELGRPTLQLYGLGKAFLLTHALSFCSDDALRVYTWSSVAAIALACLFGFLLLESLGLHPLACLTGALGIGIGSLTLYSPAFTLFLWGVCWTTALFWCVTLFTRRPSLASALGLAFTTNALLLTAYPQYVVWQAYPLAGYALWRLARSNRGWRSALALGAALAGCVLAGALGAAPVYWDLLETARQSTRLPFDPVFFARILPDLSGLEGKGAFVASLLDAFAFGSPASADYPSRAEPFLLPLWSCLVLAGLATSDLRRLWPILAFTLAVLLMTVWKEAYLVAVRTVGLGLSRSVPIRLAHLAVIVLAARAAHDVLTGERHAPGRAVASILAGVGLATGGVAAADLPLERASLGFGAAAALGTLAFVLTRRGWLLATLALASALYHGSRLQTARGRDELRMDSPLVELLRRETADGSRFAWAGASLGDFLPPNQETLYGLRSIHSYDPLFSARYQDWASRYRQTQARITHDRRFLSVIRLDAFLAESAALSGTRILLSLHDQTPSGVALLGTFGPIGVFRTSAPPVLELQTERFEREGPGAVRIEPPRPGSPTLETRRALAQDDRLVFRLTPAERETLLFVSQQHHAGWRARARGRALETVVVNGLFQGVLVPPEVDQVELEFRCAARWSWVPQALFALAALLLLARRLFR
jgi:hypothetical protein